MDYMPQFGQNTNQDQMPQDDAMMQLELQRRMKFADALRSQAAPEGQMVSGHYVAPSWTQQLAGLANKYVAGQQEQEAMKQYGDYQTAKSAKLGTLLDELNKGKQVESPVDYQDAGGMPGITQTTQQPFNQQEYMAKIGAVMPEMLPKMLEANFAQRFKEQTPIKGGPGDRFFDPITHKEIFAVPPKEEALKSEYANVQQDPQTGKFFGVNIKTNQVEQIPGAAMSPKPAMTAYEAAQIKLHQADQANKENGKFDDATLNMLADQALAGDKSVFTGLGRGNQGANNIAAVRQRINQKMIDKGMNGADIAAMNAQFMGQLAGARAVGTRGANVELAGSGFENIVPIAQAASAQVVRSGFLPFGKAEIMFDEQTNNTALSSFAAANNGLVNTYARAISPTGVPTVEDKKHARKILSEAKSPDAYNAAVTTLQKEIQAEIQAPKHVREMQRQEISGRNQPLGLPASNDIAAELKRRGL